MCLRPGLLSLYSCDCPKVVLGGPAVAGWMNKPWFCCTGGRKNTGESQIPEPEWKKLVFRVASGVSHVCGLLEREEPQGGRQASSCRGQDGEALTAEGSIKIRPDGGVAA